MAKEIDETTFALVCFLVLMQNIQSKTPIYIVEKSSMLKMGWEAFVMLDVHNKTKVLDWVWNWNLSVPAKITENHRKEIEAGEELGLL